MKKLHLSINEPCHQNWDAMQPDGQGRHCASCQKKVIDFTGMSDRELAAFFKKPQGQICGRLRQEQLERDIMFPDVRIPWVSYFFRFTWPALVLLLKSCVQREQHPVNHPISVQGSNKISLNKIPVATVGVMISEITPLNKDTLPNQKVNFTVSTKEDKVLTGDNEIAVPERKDTLGLTESGDSGELKDSISENMMDTVLIRNNENPIVLLGGISSCRVKIKNVEQNKKELMEQLPVDNMEQQFQIFPNPVHAGALLTIGVPNPSDMPEEISIINASGQLVASYHQSPSSYESVVNVRIPQHVLPGIYFVSLSHPSWKKRFTQRILVQ